jgi:hypothetical protein
MKEQPVDAAIRISAVARVIFLIALPHSKRKGIQETLNANLVLALTSDNIGHVLMFSIADNRGHSAPPCAGSTQTGYHS